MEIREAKDFDLSEYQDLVHLFLDPLSCVSLNNQNMRPLGNFSDLIIIYPPTIDWYFMKQRPHHLMEQFALHGFQVYYCNKLQQVDLSPTPVQSNLSVVFNNRKFICKTIPELKKQGKKILLWVSWPKLHLFLDQYGPDYVVFDYVDDFPSWEPYLEKMVDKADVVIATSSILKRRIENIRPSKHSYLIPNGCNIDQFLKYENSPPPRPLEYRGHQGPVITYIGAWAPWIDQDLVKKVACSFPRALVGIIGVEFGGAKVDTSMPNLNYIGYKFHQSLPQYLYHSDVCLIPFQINQITLATNPVKVYEYLAAGKPVVATDIPEIRDIPGVLIGRDHSSFIEQVAKVLASPGSVNREKVTGWLTNQTWEKRYQSIVEVVKSNCIAKT